MAPSTNLLACEVRCSAVGAAKGKKKLIQLFIVLTRAVRLEATTPDTLFLHRPRAVRCKTHTLLLHRVRWGGTS